jgi:hypothetical protein
MRLEMLSMCLMSLSPDLQSMRGRVNIGLGQERHAEI